MMRFSDRIIRIVQAARAEKPVPEKIIQQQTAIRFPVDYVRVLNVGEGVPGYLYAYRFAQVVEFNPLNNLYSIKKPADASYDWGLMKLSAGQLVMLEQNIPSGTYGKAYIGGIHKIQISSSSEDIVIGDTVGTDVNGLAVKLGPFICLKVDGDYVYVRPEYVL